MGLFVFLKKGDKSPKTAGGATGRKEVKRAAPSRSTEDDDVDGDAPMVREKDDDDE